MIETCESRWAMGIARMFRGQELPPAALWIALLHPEPGPAYVPPVGDAKKPAVLVRVNAGIWLADCPWCRSAQQD